MFTTEVKNNKSSSTKSFYLTLQILGVAFSLLFTTSCNQKGYNKIPQKPSETSPQTNNQEFAPFPDYAEKTKKHATFNGKVSEFIWQIYQDKNAHYWFGTNHDGILFYDNNTLKHYTSKDGIGGNAVRAILEDQEGNIWFGTSNGLSTFNGTTFKTFEVPKPKINNAEPMLSQNRVSDILIDKDNKIWFVNDGYGVTKYNGHTFEFYSKENGLTDNSVADLFEDSNGTIWIGTYYGGVSTYDGKDFTNFTEKGIIKGIETYNFFEDKKGNIWFSAENQGVYRYNGNEFKLYTMADGLATNGIQSIFQDHKGQVWFSTWDGLSLFDGNQIVNASEREPWTD